MAALLFILERVLNLGGSLIWTDKVYKSGDIVKLRHLSLADSANSLVVIYIDQIRGIVNSRVVFKRESPGERTLLIASDTTELGFLNAFVVENKSVTDQEHSNLSSFEIEENKEEYVGIPISVQVREEWIQKKLGSVPRSRVDELIELKKSWTFP